MNNIEICYFYFHLPFFPSLVTMGAGKFFGGLSTFSPKGKSYVTVEVCVDISMWK